jgi:hypothetical protein
MICPTCLLFKSKKFCDTDGTALIAYECWNCGNSLTLEQKYCEKCGSSTGAMKQDFLTKFVTSPLDSAPCVKPISPLDERAYELTNRDTKPQRRKFQSKTT